MSGRLRLVGTRGTGEISDREEYGCDWRRKKRARILAGEYSVFISLVQVETAWEICCDAVVEAKTAGEHWESAAGKILAGRAAARLFRAVATPDFGGVCA